MGRRVSEERERERERGVAWQCTSDGGADVIALVIVLLEGIGGDVAKGVHRHNLRGRERERREVTERERR